MGGTWPHSFDCVIHRLSTIGTPKQYAARDFKVVGLNLHPLASLEAIKRVMRERSASASISFSFDICMYKEQLVNSISSVQLKGEIDSILDNALDGVTSVIGSSIKDKIKSFVTSTAESKVNGIKDKIIQEINSFSCSGSVHELDIVFDGTVSYSDVTFNALARKLRAINGVVNADAGLFTASSELGIKIDIKSEGNLSSSDFEDAFDSVFDALNQAQEAFGVSPSEKANVTNLFAGASSLASVSLSLSTGFKVANLTSFFSPDLFPIDNLFLRIENFMVKAEASSESINTALFNNVDIEDGSLFIDVGAKIRVPFEAKLLIDGSLANGLGFSDTIQTITFQPTGQFLASLPFVINMADTSQKFIITAQDNNIFDDEAFTAKVDFDACPIVGMLQSLLSQLSGLTINPQGIIGNTIFSGLDLFSAVDGIDSLDAFFPNVSLFTNRILKGARVAEFVLLCLLY